MKSSSKAERSNEVGKKQKALRPLLSVSRPPTFNLSGKGKAKEKSKAQVISLLDDSDEDAPSSVPVHDDRLWVDRYEPQSETELAVHKRKVEDVRRWFQEAFEGGPEGKLKKYRRILVLTGLAGTGKTTTVRVLAKEMGFGISEWQSTLEESYTGEDYEREGLNQKFETFLARAATCRSLLGEANEPSTSTSLAASPSSSRSKKQIVLLEDLPNILHQPTQATFHAALESFLGTPAGMPLVIIISDASTRGEFRDENLAGGGGSYRSTKDTVDIRSVLPSGFINGPFVTQIAFNPVAPTLMLRALQELLTRHYANSAVPPNERPTKDDLNIIIETSNGDIRSAVMALQFSCVLDNSVHYGKSGLAKGKKRNVGASTRSLMEAVTRREQALALFHLMGKVLYNKRKGDPPSSSASAKDKLREAELDARLKKPPPLLPWLADHERRPSRVDVDTLYADSPIDTGLFSLYIHQNYPQFCNDIEESSNLSDWLSWIDSSGGEHWYQTNPHQFHLLTLGTLHALPSPVVRHGQKMYKPEFFDVLKKTREAEDAVNDVWRWLQDSGSTRWARSEIALEMGAVLKTRTRDIFGGGHLNDVIPPPPPHSVFSTLIYSNSKTSGTATLDVDGNDECETEASKEEDIPRSVAERSKTNDEGGMWLENDDIEEF
ncbi:hypothetical protein M0805_000022 [Coniferiporia weirii]|nr:hypothetical protein M0805_000022 [Coniferiporia weirii]